MAQGRSYEKCWDMPFGGTSDERHISKWFACIAATLVSIAFKICFRYRIDGKENLYKLFGKTGVVLVANHTSFLDVIFIYLSCIWKVWPRFIARDTLFDGKPWIFGWLLSHVGVFPIKRDSADRTAIKRAAKMLKTGEAIAILPEGTRRGKGSKTPEIHGGAGLIARMGKAPLLPMTVRDAENVKRKGEHVRFPKITIEFGQPVLLEDFDFLPKEDRLDGCVWYAMRECFALSKRIAPDEVNMVDLFPEGKDFTAVFAEHAVPRHTTDELVASLEAEEQKKLARAAAKAEASVVADASDSE